MHTVAKMQPDAVPDDLNEDLQFYSNSIDNVTNQAGKGYNWKAQRDIFQKNFVKLAKGGKKLDTFANKLNATLNGVPKVLKS